MENHNQRDTAPSITSILKKTSDDKGLALFNRIAVSTDNDRLIPLREMNLSAKQYYSRISGLVDAGLIKRNKGRYFLTLLGKVVYDSHKTIGKTYYWKLKAIESIETANSGLPNEDTAQLINALIDNHQIKGILMKATSNTSIDMNSKAQTATAMIKEIQVQNQKLCNNKIVLP